MSTLTVSYINQDFSPPNVGPIATISAVLTAGNAANSQTLSIPLAATSVSAALNPDTYTWVLTNADAAGNSYGGPFTGSFTVTVVTPVTLSLANGLTLFCLRLASHIHLRKEPHDREHSAS